MTKPVDLSKLSTQITEFTNLLISSANHTDMTKMVVPDYLNMTIWGEVNAQLIAAISDPQLLMQ